MIRDSPSNIMEIIIILLIVVITILGIKKISSSNKKETYKSSYKDYDISKRSSPHPNDTPLGYPHSNTSKNKKVWKSDYVEKIQTQLDVLSKLPHDSTQEKGKYLFFDTETTGLPRKRDAFPEDFSNWPYIVEIAWLLVDEEGLQVSGGHYIVKQKVSIPQKATEIHHITTEKMLSEGIDPKEVYTDFLESVNNADYIVAHNIEFDEPIIECELLRNGFDKALSSKKHFCTMKAGKDFCTVYSSSGSIKNPKLSELFGSLYFDNPYLTIEGLHNALSDTLMLYRCFMKMKEIEPHLLDEKIDINVMAQVQYSKSDIPDFSMENQLPMISEEDLFSYFGDSLFNGSQVLVTGVDSEDKENYWKMITDLNGKVVKSVTKNLAIVVLGPTPGWKKLEAINQKIQNGEKIIGITDIQLELLYKHSMN